MSFYKTEQLGYHDINDDINNLHDIIHNLNEHRFWWKKALIIALSFIAVGFGFIWALFGVNENRSMEFDALIYSSAAVLIIVLIILSLLFFYRNAKEPEDFGNQIKSYISKLNTEMAKRDEVARIRLQQENEKTKTALRATDILAQRNKQSAIGAAAERWVY